PGYCSALVVQDVKPGAIKRNTLPRVAQEPFKTASLMVLYLVSPPILALHAGRKKLALDLGKAHGAANRPALGNPLTSVVPTRSRTPGACRQHWSKCFPLSGRRHLHLRSRTA